MQKSILWVAHEGGLSGANICLLEYLQIMKDAGFKNYLVVPYIGEMSKAAAEVAEKVVEVKFYTWIWPLNKPAAPLRHRLKKFFRNRVAVKRLRDLVSSLSPTYVVTNTVTTPVAALAASRTGTKHIWFIHEFGEEDHGYKIAGSFSNAASIMSKLSSKLAFNSTAIQRKYEPFVPANKRFIVHNATLMTAPDTASSPSGPVVKLIMLGQVARAKNQLHALQALQICMQRGLKFHLSIVGKAEDSEYKEELLGFVIDNGMRDCVTFVGPSTEPSLHLQQNEVLLMCSRMEAFGRVTVEALKHGLPVIAANSGGSPEIIEDGRNGLLFETGNVPDLADKILLYASNRERFNRSEIASEARELYNIRNTEKQLLQVFS